MQFAITTHIWLTSIAKIMKKIDQIGTKISKFCSIRDKKSQNLPTFCSIRIKKTALVSPLPGGRNFLDWPKRSSRKINVAINIFLLRDFRCPQIWSKNDTLFFVLRSYLVQMTLREQYQKITKIVIFWNLIEKMMCILLSLRRVHAFCTIFKSVNNNKTHFSRF